MERIIIHWTAGTLFPNGTDRQHYHFLIDGKGNVHTGKFKPEDNLNCKDGKYAEHTGGGNTGSIGVAFCGMLGFKNSLCPGEHTFTKEQMEAGYKKIAELCKAYKIPVTPQSVMTHYEFGKAHPKTTSAGKIDITFLATEHKLSPDEIGDFLRGKIDWYLKKIGK